MSMFDEDPIDEIERPPVFGDPEIIKKILIILVLAAVAVAAIASLGNIKKNGPKSIDKSLFRRGEIVEALYLGASDRLRNQPGLMMYSMGLLETVQDHDDPRCRKIVDAMEPEIQAIGALVSAGARAANAIMDMEVTQSDVNDLGTIATMKRLGADDARTLIDPKGPFGCDSPVMRRILAGIRGEIPESARN